MIYDKSNGRPDEIKAFARTNNLLESFNETFSILENHSDKGYKGKAYFLFLIHLWAKLKQNIHLWNLLN